MKKIIALLLCMVLAFTLASCGKYGEIGGPVVMEFRDNADESVEDIADAVVENSDLSLLTAPVDEGLLEGFSNMPINGFENGVMISSADHSIPFISYIFEMSDSVDQNMFVANLKTYADPNFSGDETENKVIVEQKGDKVIVVITPDKVEDKKDSETISDTDVEDEMVIQGDEFVDAFE
ncbi:MAG: hypothetical protein IJD68_05550 [Ruminococcus sp.]|nr:hypothetical protein [Ruminococcus sp.]